MRGAYLGPYPTREEAFESLDGAAQIPIREVLAERITLGDRTVLLSLGLAMELLRDTEWVFANDPLNAKYFQEDFGHLASITATIVDDQCLILRIPSQYCCDEAGSTSQCAGVALIDTATGKLFAIYGESGYHCGNRIRRWN